MHRQRTLGTLRLTAMALRIVAPLACVVLPWHAVAHEENATSDAAARAGAEAWFRQYIKPDLAAGGVSDQSEVLSVPLERPGEHPGAAAPAKPAPRRLGALAPLGMLVLDVDVPQPRGNWSDALQPQMFRLYFEPIPPPTAPRPTLPRGRAAGV